MNSIEKLTQIFSHFPGVGERQAKRFVYYLLSRKSNAVDDLVEAINSLKQEIAICEDCMRFFKKEREEKLCKICSNAERERSNLVIVQKDIDLESVERSGNFKGVYFVLGGSVRILDKEPEKKVRINELKSFIERKNIKEIILATNWNPEGENTADYVERQIKAICEKKNIKISHLGKGLSMGTELEYTDPDTLKNALKNRS